MQSYLHKIMAETRSTRLKYVKRKRICFQYLKKIIANTELFVVKTEISSSKNPNLLIRECRSHLFYYGKIWHLQNFFFSILGDKFNLQIYNLKPATVNPIPTGCCHVTLIYGLILPMAGRNRVKGYIYLTPYVHSGH